MKRLKLAIRDWDEDENPIYDGDDIDEERESVLKLLEELETKAGNGIRGKEPKEALWDIKKQLEAAIEQLREATKE